MGIKKTKRKKSSSEKFRKGYYRGVSDIVYYQALLTSEEEFISWLDKLTKIVSVLSTNRRNNDNTN